MSGHAPLVSPGSASVAVPWSCPAQPQLLRSPLITRLGLSHTAGRPPRPLNNHIISIRVHPSSSSASSMTKRGEKIRGLFFQALLVLLNNNFPGGNDEHVEQLHDMRNSNQTPRREVYERGWVQAATVQTWRPGFIRDLASTSVFSKLWLTPRPPACGCI